jgi:hypothetical protein
MSSNVNVEARVSSVFERLRSFGDILGEHSPLSISGGAE